ncbi:MULTISPECIES: YMGG-like glycine zipper-containing protein [Spirosoma]|uniref:YMGG-like glycine zipper-containing protein n=1 Tax=Spirosoma liriopis TaxID=2937440 RepID=A0ABT0HQK5_9BACT|nr:MULTISPECIES: YMGG-like glycine zipper-containing protein [Spirosoma]MCK8494260.1 YMGG-like glycine zipper-containing protein [Spirosoma liriopis]UHG89273.1 YMGG-like glycine zipper-containing protein [Spirosoma oryzicola]
MKTIHHKIGLLFLLVTLLGHTSQAQSRSGWGPQTTGAVVGTGVGAVAGAVINKRNPAVGGVVGGVLGGASGYAIGKQKKKRWSPQAKGTAIGAGVGGAAGAIINRRNRVVGGLIGGVAGGAAGYAIGKHVDNKRKKEAAARAAAEQEALARAEAEREAAARVANTANNDLAPYVPTARTRSAVAATATPAVQPQALYNPKTAPVSYILREGFLPNESYGDPSTPYGESEYRRKSW